MSGKLPKLPPNTHRLISSLREPWGVEPPLWQVEKMRLREEKSILQGHRASKREGSRSNLAPQLYSIVPPRPKAPGLGAFSLPSLLEFCSVFGGLQGTAGDKAEC